MHYWPSVRSRRLDFGQVLLCVFMDWDEVKVNNKTKKNKGDIKPSWLNKLGQWRIYFMTTERKFSLRDERGKSRATYLNRSQIQPYKVVISPPSLWYKLLRNKPTKSPLPLCISPGFMAGNLCICRGYNPLIFRAQNCDLLTSRQYD